MAYSARLRHANDRTGLIVMASLFCPITILVVVLRFYARRLTRAGFGADDWLALAALVFVLALKGIFLGGTIEGAITGHSPVVNNWPVSTELEHLAQKYKYAYQATEKVAFGLIKLSLLFLWKRLFGHPRSFVIFCWIMIGVTIAWAVAFFFATIFQCGTNWQMNWAPIGDFLTRCIDTVNALTVFTATDIFTDFIIMFMPVPIIWKLQMPTKKKIGVTSIFMVGLFTIGAGIARMYMYLVTSYDKESNPDFIADFTLFILWSEIEVTVAMIVCCMPTLGPVIGKCRDGLIHHLRSIIPSSWVLLSSDRTGGKSSTRDTELSLTSKPNHPSCGRHSYGGMPWQGGFGAVTTAGYSDTEEPYTHSQGILARTEISRTSEAKPVDFESGRHSEV